MTIIKDTTEFTSDTALQASWKQDVPVATPEGICFIKRSRATTVVYGGGISTAASSAGYSVFPIHDGTCQVTTKNPVLNLRVVDCHYTTDSEMAFLGTIVGNLATDLDIQDGRYEEGISYNFNNSTGLSNVKSMNGRIITIILSD